MIDLIFVACLVSTGGSCERMRVAEFTMPMACVVAAQPLQAQWEAQHPARVVVTTVCEPRRPDRVV